ncbi:MAG: CPBP family intramembrane metalloprotease [Aureispira sp.]|nr:CPBP family intramembrane metalloprotease [Aureispira sp.]
MNKKSSIWLIVEATFAPFILVYFLGYPRDTLSDFIVCTIISILIYIWGSKLGLHKPAIQQLQKFDRTLLFITIGLFLFAWIYGAVYNKITFQTALSSIAITFTYFYYAAIQHFLAQRYLALRMLSISQQWSKVPEFHAAAMTGVIFGIMHIPYPNLIIPSAIGGFAYAYYFLNTGKLWAVIVSHALISSAILYWILDENPFTELIDFWVQ